MDGGRGPGGLIPPSSCRSASEPRRGGASGRSLHRRPSRFLQTTGGMRLVDMTRHRTISTHRPTPAGIPSLRPKSSVRLGLEPTAKTPPSVPHSSQLPTTSPTAPALLQTLNPHATYNTLALPSASAPHPRSLYITCLSDPASGGSRSPGHCHVSPGTWEAAGGVVQRLDLAAWLRLAWPVAGPIAACFVQTMGKRSVCCTE